MKLAFLSAIVFPRAEKQFSRTRTHLEGNRQLPRELVDEREIFDAEVERERRVVVPREDRGRVMLGDEAVGGVMARSRAIRLVG